MVPNSFESLVALLGPTALFTSLWIAVASSADAAQPATPEWVFDSEVLWAGLEPGSYQVGYRVEQRIDSSRTFADTAGGQRPMQISLWYPASSIEGMPRIRISPA